MAKIQIFGTYIIQDKFFNPEVDEEITKVLKEEEKGKGVLKSNFGGFQTNIIENKIICDNLLHKSVKLITDTYKLKNKIKFELKNLWINKNFKNSFNLPHIHPNSHFSGVYYLNVSEKLGELVFLKNDNIDQLGLYDFIDSKDFYNSYTIKPNKGVIILFPSSLSHMVTPHMEDIERISISFNIEMNHG
jgi:uncharacterized protein (TIGR02466 family)